MQPPTDRTDELVKTAAQALARLVIAHERCDFPAITGEVVRLLNAIAAYNRACAEPPGHAELRRAIARLG
jgi:hypothetical protein